MPRKSSKKTTKVSKPMLNKAKKILAKTKRTKAKKNMDNFFFKAKTEAVIKPSQGATVANYISSFWSLMSATSVVGVTQNQEFQLYRTLYDKVRINSIKITIKPKANVLDQYNAQNDLLINSTGSGVFHSVIDRDDQPPANIPRLSRYPSYKRTSVLKPLTRMYSIRYPTNVWLDCQNIYEDNTLLKRLGAFGGIYIYAENLLEDNLEIFNEPWAEVLLEYNCVFQGKTSAGITMDGDRVILTPVLSSQVIPNSEVIPTSGTFSNVKFDQTGTQLSNDDNSAPI